MKRFLIVPSLVLAVLLALCILNAAALNRRTNRWMDIGGFGGKICSVG